MLNLKQAKYIADELVEGDKHSTNPRHLVGWMWEALKKGMTAKEQAELDAHFEALLQVSEEQADRCAKL